jgi:hypothetical protein
MIAIGLIVAAASIQGSQRQRESSENQEFDGGISH